MPGAGDRRLAREMTLSGEWDVIDVSSEITSVLRFRGCFGRSIRLKSRDSGKSLSETAMRVTRIRLTNIRLFKSLDLPITRDSMSSPRMKTLFIGKNGTCKSTLLRCLAVALTQSQSGREVLLQQIGSSLVGPHAESGLIELELAPFDGVRHHEDLFIQIRIHQDSHVQDGHVDLSAKIGAFAGVFGYGPGRFSSGPARTEASSINSCRTLFRFDERLVDPELALRRLRDFLGTTTYDTTMTGIKRAIGLRPADQIIVGRGGGVIVKTKSGTFPLSALADGHRVPFGFALDLYHSALQAEAVTKSGGIRGVLLLDEIEQHLHPSLQSGVLGRFGRLWPELQVFATTHSPLVALGAKPYEVVSLKRSGSRINAIWPVPNFSAFTADDMLEEQRLFDTFAMTPANAKELENYQQLVSVPRTQRTKAQTAKLRKLAAAQLAGQPESAQANPFDSLMADVRRKFKL